MKFKVDEIIFTGSETRNNKEGKSYTLINYLDPDNGNSFSTMTDIIVPPMLKQLDRVKVVFNLQAGRFTSIRTLSIEKI